MTGRRRRAAKKDSVEEPVEEEEQAVEEQVTKRRRRVAKKVPVEEPVDEPMEEPEEEPVTKRVKETVEEQPVSPEPEVEEEEPPVEREPTPEPPPSWRHANMLELLLKETNDPCSSSKKLVRAPENFIVQIIDNDRGKFILLKLDFDDKTEFNWRIYPCNEKEIEGCGITLNIAGHVLMSKSVVGQEEYLRSYLSATDPYRKSGFEIIDWLSSHYCVRLREITFPGIDRADLSWETLTTVERLTIESCIIISSLEEVLKKRHAKELVTAIEFVDLWEPKSSIHGVSQYFEHVDITRAELDGKGLSFEEIIGYTKDLLTQTQFHWTTTLKEWKPEQLVKFKKELKLSDVDEKWRKRVVWFDPSHNQKQYLKFWRSRDGGENGVVFYFVDPYEEGKYTTMIMVNWSKEKFHGVESLKKDPRYINVRRVLYSS